MRSRLLPTVLAGAMACTAVACSDDDVPPPPTTTTTTVPTTTPTTEAPVEAGQVRYVYVPEVGDCFDRRRLEPEQGGELVVLLLDCSLPHQFQVFGVLDVTPDDLAPPEYATTTTTTTEPPAPPTTEPESDDDPAAGAGAGTTTTTTEPDEVAEPEGEAGDGWPSEDALERLAKLRCAPLFADWVGTPYERSELEMSWLLPTREGWAEGSRRIGCLVYDPTAERFGGSAQGSQR